MELPQRSTRDLLVSTTPPTWQSCNSPRMHLLYGICVHTAPESMLMQKRAKRKKTVSIIHRLGYVLWEDMCEETKPCRLSHFQKYDQYTGPSMYCMIEAKNYKVHRFQGKQFLVNVFQVKKLHSSENYHLVFHKLSALLSWLTLGHPQHINQTNDAFRHTTF